MVPLSLPLMGEEAGEEEEGEGGMTGLEVVVVEEGLEVAEEVALVVVVEVEVLRHATPCLSR